MKIVTLQQIGDSLGMSKQAVDKLFVKKGFLAKNKKGKIDIDNHQNYEFLQQKGADFACFGIIAKPVKKEKVAPPDRIEKPVKEKKEVQRPERSENKRTYLLELEHELKIENIKAKQKDTELKTLKIMEMQKELIPRKLVDQLIGDFFGRFNEMLITKPKGIIGDIKAELREGTDASLVILLQKSYTRELEKLMQNAQKRYIDSIDEQINEMKKQKQNESDD